MIAGTTSGLAKNQRRMMLISAYGRSVYQLSIHFRLYKVFNIIKSNPRKVEQHLRNLRCNWF
jgi:hypothetical protein